MKNLQKGFIVPVLLAIIALLVVGGGVYIYVSKKTETPVNTETSPATNQQNTSNNTPANTPPSGQTDNNGVSLAQPTKQVICSNNSAVTGQISDTQYQNNLNFVAKGKNCATVTQNFNGYILNVNGSPTSAYATVFLAFYNQNFSPDGKHFAFTASDLKDNGRGDFYFNLNGKFQRYIVSDNVRGKTYDDVYRPQYSQDGNHLGYCAKISGQYFKVIDGQEQQISESDYSNSCDLLFGYNPNPDINQNLHKDITSPDGKKILSESPCANTRAECAIYKTITNVSTGANTKYGPYSMVTQNIFSPDSKHFLYIASFAKSTGQYDALVIDGKEGEHYNEVFNLNLSADGKSATYNARSQNTIYYIVQPLN
jgi:hypothetical protein